MALAYVQSQYQKNTFAAPNITMGSALTNGNKLYVFAMMALASGHTIDTTHWTIESTNGPGGTTSTQYLLSRTVSGDGTTPPVLTDSGDTGGINFLVAIEVSGGAAVEAVSQSTSESSPISGPTTVAAGCLGLRCSTNNGGFGSYGPGTGWTNRQYNTNASTIADTTTSTVAAGTDLSGAVTNSAGGTSGHWMVVSLKLSANTETGTGTLAFGPFAFSGSAKDSHVGIGTMAFGPFKFVASGTARDEATGTMAFGPFAFVGLAAGQNQGSAKLAFGPFAFAASGAASHTGTGVLAYGPFKFAAGAGLAEHTGVGSLAFGPFRFVASGAARHTGAGILAFGPFKIVGLGFDLGHTPSTKVAARDTLAQEKLQPLTWNVPIVDSNSGFPSQELQRKWERNLKIIEAQIKVNAAITPKSYIDAAVAAALAAANGYAASQAASAQSTAEAYTDARVLPGIRHIAALPPAPLLNTRALVDDSTQTLAAGLGNTDAGGGGNTVPMYFDGAWKIG